MVRPGDCTLRELDVTGGFGSKMEEMLEVGPLVWPQPGEEWRQEVREGASEAQGGEVGWALGNLADRRGESRGWSQGPSRASGVGGSLRSGGGQPG